MRKIFVNYRREPDQYVAGNLSRELRGHFGDSQVFRDKESIEGGVSWKQHVLDEIDRDSVLLVLIGQKWSDVRDAGGNRRLDKPDDPVRLEIADAMRDGAAIIPLLLENAQMPPASELPQELIQLAELNALKLRDGDWEADVAKIVQRLEKLGAKRVTGADSQPVNVDDQALDTMISTRGSLPENEYQEQASGTNITPAKWGLAAALAGLIVAVGAGIYLSKPVRFVVDKEAMLQKEHETGFILIQGAAEKASLACRELREIDLKRQNLEIAKGLGDTGLVDAYTTQIEEIAQNIRDHASEYKGLIGRLVGLKKPVAEAEFQHYANELLGKKSFDQIHVSRLVQRQYQDHLHGASAEHVRLTRETCIEEYRNTDLNLRLGGERRDVSQNARCSGSTGESQVFGPPQGAELFRETPVAFMVPKVLALTINHAPDPLPKRSELMAFQTRDRHHPEIEPAIPSCLAAQHEIRHYEFHDISGGIGPVAHEIQG
ncbi:MAG: toll/interleukin-1 receptor domain-containing protein [Gammaproteobacteria bacterium]|nr:toll/interleukin-1 receptor domain-containing protein [Gammaproteobacteria bacterium]